MSYEAATAPAIGSPSATTPTQLDELTAPRFQIAAAQEESVEELAVENSATGYQQRIAELTQETERLVGEVNLANEALEPLRAQLQTRSDLQGDLTERLSTASQENAALAKLNSELQTKISELEASAGEADRVETELVIAQAALRQMSEDLAKARKSTKLDAIAEQLGPALQLNPAESTEELERIQTAPAEARGERDKISDPPAQLEQFAVEDHELRIAATKTREEAVLAKRCFSDQTNEEFDRIRRALVAKQNQKPDKAMALRVLLRRFLRPFRVTARTERIP
jgi:myosin heavy subunit